MLIRRLYLVSVFPNKSVNFWHSKYQFGPLCPLSLDPLLEPGLICSRKKVKLGMQKLFLQSILSLYRATQNCGEFLLGPGRREIGCHPVQLAQEKSSFLVLTDSPFHADLWLTGRALEFWPFFPSAHNLFHIVRGKAWGKGAKEKKSRNPDCWTHKYFPPLIRE